eukprot:5177417-Prymnesium_polylepis.1
MMLPITILLCSSSVKLFNVGLPRSGTTWFHAAMKLSGLRSLHCNEADGCQSIDKSKLNAAFENGDTAYIRAVISKFDAFSDLPWYNHAEEMRRLMPNSPVYLATIRPYSDWSRSVRPLLPYMTKTCTDLSLPLCTQDAIPQIYFSHLPAAFAHFGTVHILDLGNINECVRILRRLTGFNFNKTVLQQHINAKFAPHPHTHKFKP